MCKKIVISFIRIKETRLNGNHYLHLEQFVTRTIFMLPKND